MTLVRDCFAVSMLLKMAFLAPSLARCSLPSLPNRMESSPSEGPKPYTQKNIESLDISQTLIKRLNNKYGVGVFSDPALLLKAFTESCKISEVRAFLPHLGSQLVVQDTRYRKTLAHYLVQKHRHLADRVKLATYQPTFRKQEAFMTLKEECQKLKNIGTELVLYLQNLSLIYYTNALYDTLGAMNICRLIGEYVGSCLNLQDGQGHTVLDWADPGTDFYHCIAQNGGMHSDEGGGLCPSTTHCLEQENEKRRFVGSFISPNDAVECNILVFEWLYRCQGIWRSKMFDTKELIGLSFYVGTQRISLKSDTISDFQNVTLRFMPPIGAYKDYRVTRILKEKDQNRLVQKLGFLKSSVNNTPVQLVFGHHTRCLSTKADLRRHGFDFEDSNIFYLIYKNALGAHNYIPLSTPFQMMELRSEAF